MSEDLEREEIAEWFRELRQREERDVPPFDAAWGVLALRLRGRGLAVSTIELSRQQRYWRF